MEDYFRAKRMLFCGEEAGASSPGTAVVNLDDDYGARLADELRNAGAELLTFSASGSAEADFRATDVEFDAAGSRFDCVGRRTATVPRRDAASRATSTSPTRSPRSPPRTALGVDAAPAARRRSQAADRVPGRFEPVDEGQDFGVLVDYAHTPDSLENVLRAARRVTAGRLICVFGCGGDRDREKRPLMGRVGAELSDLAIVTSDNPRSEDPEAIIAEILAGAGGDGVEVEADRRAAIALARRARGERRHRRDRGQGPRAGSGVRGRAQDAVRRSRGRARGAAPSLGGSVIELDAERIAEAAGRRGRAQRARRTAPARASSTRARPARATSSSASPGEQRRRRRVRRRGARRGRLGRLVSAERARDLEPADDVEAGSSPRPTRCAALQGWRANGAASCRCRVVGITGSAGKTSVKDICHALLPFRVHASPENFNTEIGLPLAVLAAPRETEVLVLEMAMRGHGPDRRAVRDRRARRRGDHQRRPGPRRAARLARGDRRGQGGDLRRPAATTGSRSCPEDAEALEPHVHELPAHDQLRPGRRRVRAPSASVADGWTDGVGRDRQHGDQRLPLPVHRGAQPRQRAGGDRGRGRARRAARRDGGAGAGDRLLAPARRAARARRGVVCRERLLQRQPDLDARRARPPRRARGPGPARRRARRDGRARPRAPSLPPRDRRARPRPRDRPDRRGRRAGGRDYAPDELVADARAAAELLAAPRVERRRGARQGLALGRPRAGQRRARGKARQCRARA